MAYADLVHQTQAQGDSYRADAWKHPLAAHGHDFHFAVFEYPYDNKPEQDLCMLAMQREMRLINVLLRKSTERLLAQQRAQRAATDASSRADPATGPVPTQP